MIFLVTAATCDSISKTENTAARETNACENQRVYTHDYFSGGDLVAVGVPGGVAAGHTSVDTCSEYKRLVKRSVQDRAPAQ